MLCQSRRKNPLMHKELKVLLLSVSLFLRIEGMMRKMQSRVPFLSEPERNMKRELESMDEKLEQYQRNLEQVRIFCCILTFQLTLAIDSRCAIVIVRFRHVSSIVINCFNGHLLQNYWLDFDETIQE